MPLSASLISSLLILGAGTPPATAQAHPITDTRAAVSRLAFDPATYFPSPYIRDRSIVRISYTGDDYAWPVYSIAIAAGCIDQENPRENGCMSQLRARMVRAPISPERTRLRQHGAHLVSQIQQRGAASTAQIAAALDEIGPQWVEADLRTCPGAPEALAQVTEAEWAPRAVAAPDPRGGDMAMVLHADIVRIELQQYARRTTYEGWVAEGSPAAWATNLSSVLEPCWRPAGLPAPWRTATDG